MTAQRRSRTRPRSRYTARRTPVAVESPPRGPQPRPPRDSTAMRPTERGPADAAVRGYARSATEGLLAAVGTGPAEGVLAAAGTGPADGCAPAIEGSRLPEGVALAPAAGVGDPEPYTGRDAAAGAMEPTRADALSSRDASAPSPWQCFISCTESEGCHITCHIRHCLKTSAGGEGCSLLSQHTPP